MSKSKIIRKKIVIDLEFGSEWQDSIHMDVIDNHLWALRECVIGKNPFSPRSCKHKKNKMEYKILDKK